MDKKERIEKRCQDQIRGIEEAHKKAADSTLSFPGDSATESTGSIKASDAVPACKTAFTLKDVVLDLLKHCQVPIGATTMTVGGLTVLLVKMGVLCPLGGILMTLLVPVVWTMATITLVRATNLDFIYGDEEPDDAVDDS